mmetsp:Transcript_4486/g.11569  ORF Transcript_4486/g.11569 Transcript_4486/m.11569 type:complete len:129 (-) Transcript_4486:222-608(-)
MVKLTKTRNLLAKEDLLHQGDVPRPRAVASTAVKMISKRISLHPHKESPLAKPADPSRKEDVRSVLAKPVDPSRKRDVRSPDRSQSLGFRKSDLRATTNENKIQRPHQSEDFLPEALSRSGAAGVAEF